MSYGRFGCAFLGILLFANFFSIGRAGVFDWTLGIDGLFNDPARWTHVSGGGNTTPPPGAGDSANFDVPGAYEVTFKTVASPFTTSFLGVSDGNVTFASDGVSSATYIVTGGGSGGDASLLGGELTLDGLDLQVADRLSTQGNSTLNIQNGSHVIAHELFLGGFFGDGFVNVIGSPSSLSVTGSVTHSLGNNKNSLLHFSGGSMGNLAGTIALGTSNDVTKTATLTVDSGSKLDTGSIIAGGVGNTAVINVSGNNSSLTQGGVSTLMLGGATGSAMLNVNSGGTFATGTGAVTFGDSATIDISDGTLNAHGAITLAAGTMLTLNGGALNANAGLDNSAGGNLSFLDGTLTVNGGEFVPNAGGEVLIDGPTLSELPHLKLDAGTDATFGGSVPLSIGKFNRGELTIAGGSMVSNSLGSIAGNTTSAEGTVTVTGTDGMGNASTWNSIGILSVGGSGTGTLRIENGGNVISHRGQLGASASGTGTVFVTGAGSSWTNLFGNLYVGGSVITGEGGVGSLTVEDQGLVYVNDVLRIFGDSEVTINGGTIAFETLQIEPGGSLAFNFGTINYLSDLSISSGDQLESLLGGSHTIPIAKKIQVDGTTTLFNVLTIDGGAFSTANLLNPQLLQFERGTLELTGASGLTIGDGELFGNSLSIGSEQNLQIANTLTIDLGATLSLRTDGSISAGTLANSGILQGSGVITATLANQVGGLVRVQASDLLTISDTAHTNDGDIQIQGGRLDFTGSLTNNTDGNILGRGTLATTGGLVNQGDLALSNGQTDVFGDVDNQTTGRVIVSGNADVTFWDDVTHTGALFNVSTGSSATFFGTAGFGISGGGDVFFEADVTPGSSPGLETFGGNVHFGAVSNLEIEIEGSTPGSEFDRLEISGAASLGGSLEVLADPDVDVSVGDLLLFIYAQGGIFNAFESVSLPTLDGGKEFRLLYGETIVGLEVILSGDYNNDGFVNAADYVVWRDSMSNNSSGYDAWRANFGATIGIGASQVVPEPATFLLAILAVVGLLFGRACPSRR